jgi:S1-C subfamily serine protease
MPARIFLCGLVLLVAACTPQRQNTLHVNTVKVGDETYTSPDAAIAGMQEATAKAVASLTPEPDPIRGTALIVIADRDRLRVVPGLLGGTFGGMSNTEFLLTMRMLTAQAAADAIVKGHVFDNATIVTMNDTAEPDMGDADFLVWYQVKSVRSNNQGPWVAGWQVKRRGIERIRPAAFDMGTHDGAPRYASFTHSVRQAALQLGGSTRAGAKPTVDKTAGKASGSGIVIGGEGYVLTAHHVIGTCAQIRVKAGDHPSVPASVLATDAPDDLAVVKAEEPLGSAAAATLRASDGLRPGDSVVVTGFPLNGLLGSDMTVTTGSVSALSGPRGDQRLAQISAPVQPGNSGGPLIDASGTVVGVVTSKLNGLVLAMSTGAIPENVNFAVKSDTVTLFLDSHHVAYRRVTGKRDHELTPTQIGEEAAKFTVLVECQQ